MIKLDLCSHSVALLKICLALPTDGNKGWDDLILFLCIRKAIHDGKRVYLSSFCTVKKVTCNRKATKGLSKLIWKKTGLNIFLFIYRYLYNTVCPHRKGLVVSLSVRKVKLQYTLDLYHLYHRFLGFLALTPQLNLKIQVCQKQQFAHRPFFQPQNSPAFDITT